MGSAVSLRSDFDGNGLRLLARQTKDASQARRLLALASIYDGGSRADAARLGSVTVQIVRNWVVRFNARGFDGLINGMAPANRRCSMTTNVRRWHKRSIAGPRPTSTALSAGVFAIWRSGCGRSSEFRRASRP